MREDKEINGRQTRYSLSRLLGSMTHYIFAQRGALMMNPIRDPDKIAADGRVMNQPR